MKNPCLLLLTFLGCLMCSAAGENTEDKDSWVATYIDGIYDAEATLKLVPGIRLTYPQGVALSGAAFIPVPKMLNRGSRDIAASSERYLLLQVEPGYGGLKSGLGFGGIDTLGKMGGLKLSHYRTWTDFASRDSGEQYMGIDATHSGYGATYTLGLYTGIDSEASDFLFSAGLGFGF